MKPVPIHPDARSRVWTAFREGYDLAKIAKWLGTSEEEFASWLQYDAPPNWQDAYLFGRRDSYRKSLKGLHKGEVARRMLDYDEANPVYNSPAKKR